MVSSVYDPLGFLAPFLLIGKQILQELCRDNCDWDQPLPDTLKQRWETWRNSLMLLRSLRINRCFKPENFGAVKSASVHHFSDASMVGYGQCSYIRLVNEHGVVQCSLVMAKSRVIPLKVVTIPRLELTAAVVSTRVSSLLSGLLIFHTARM